MTTWALKIAILFIHFGAYAASETQLTVADLVNRGRIPLLNAVTTEVQSGEKYLNLNDCDLTSLDGVADLPGITTVQKLDVRNNRLSSLKKADLACMPHLKHIYANNNQIEHIAEDAFAENPCLIGISLSDNKLQEASAILRIFKQLQLIDLKCNQLESFEPLVCNLTLQFCNVADNPGAYQFPRVGTLLTLCPQLKYFEDTPAYCTEQYYNKSKWR